MTKSTTAKALASLFIARCSTIQAVFQGSDGLLEIG
jgi:hypothetical protein